MLIRMVNDNDQNAWLELAAEVSSLFQHSANMGADPQFIAYVQSKTSKCEALTAVDYMSGNNMGFIGFSRALNRISWFAVAKQYRGKGAGDRLLKTVLRQLDPTRDITVVTFTKVDPQGAAARTLYRKYGFTEEKAVVYDGLPRCEMTRPASNEKHGGSFHYRYPEFIRAA